MEKREWVPAGTGFGDPAFEEALADQIHELGISLEEVQSVVSDFDRKDERRVIQEATALGSHALNEAQRLREWHGEFHKGQTLKGGPVRLSPAVKQQVQKRLEEGYGSRKHLLFLLMADAIAAASEAATE